ncbi:MAG: Stp1/IreP family PP2C-type Ser/Thr phosphatase [Ktedonobacterales bacterium]
MTKQLRLASAVLTDVGRKRERNQDNVTQYIPPERDVFDDKGALFIVCDGMGGHAAGEVAAELGVGTISEVYYASRGEDVISSVAHAVKAANEAIYARASQNPEMAGMGTTCVTLIVSGGRAYIVNIGDSRAYLIRDGKMRQVTQDHSWVAEQVRMGLLTEEQARVHAHRNVITRSLGTQPTITADLFVETLHDGDRILICSDGLHGYVDEAAIEREVLSPVTPDVATRDLIDMANANGGPDNISAIVVDILEAPEVAGPVPLPPTVDNPIEEGTTQPLPAIPDKAKIATRTAAKSAPAAIAASKPTARRKRRAGPLLVAIRIVEVAALLVIAVGIWYVGFGPYAQQRNATTQTQTDISRVQTAVQQANQQDPATALKTLAIARLQVIGDLNNPNLDAATRQQAQTALTQLQPAVQNTVRRYNAAALIQPVTVTQAVIYPLANCLTPGSTTPSALTSVSALAPVAQPAPKAGTAGTQMLYALSGGSLYETLTPLGMDGNPGQGDATCEQVVLKGVTVIGLTSVGNTVYALGQDADGKYAVYAVQPQGFNKDGSVNAKISVRVSLPTTGETPTALTVAGNNTYVGFTGGVATPTGLWFFNGKGNTPALTIALPSKPATLGVGGATIYLLLSDGSVGQLDAQNIYLPLSVVAAPPALTTDPSIYSVSTPVPTPALTPTGADAATPTATSTPAPTDTTGAGTPTPTPIPTQPPISIVGTLFASGATLAIDPTTPTNVLIGDGALSRVVRLVASASGPGLGLNAQYVYGPPLDHASGLALAAGKVMMSATGPTATPGTTTTIPILNAYVWSNGDLVTFPIPEPAAGA